MTVWEMMDPVEAPAAITTTTELLLLLLRRARRNRLYLAAKDLRYAPSEVVQSGRLPEAAI